MCEWGTVAHLPIGGRVYSIDRCIHHIVAALNAGGVNTTASCCGHGKIPGSIILQDGRWLVVMPEKQAQAFFCSWPHDIHGNTREMTDER